MSTLKIETHNTSLSVDDVQGFSLGFELDCTYAILTELFGEPIKDHSEPNKIQAEWYVCAEDENGDTYYFTVYDWKIEGNCKQNTVWNVGVKRGTKYEIMDLIDEFVYNAIADTRGKAVKQ
jgi:hypothetical protein